MGVWENLGREVGAGGVELWVRAMVVWRVLLRCSRVAEVEGALEVKGLLPRVLKRCRGHCKG